MKNSLFKAGHWPFIRTFHLPLFLHFGYFSGNSVMKFKVFIQLSAFLDGPFLASNFS